MIIIRIKVILIHILQTGKLTLREDNYPLWPHSWSLVIHTWGLLTAYSMHSILCCIAPLMAEGLRGKGGGNICSNSQMGPGGAGWGGEAKAGVSHCRESEGIQALARHIWLEWSGELTI